MNLVVVLVRTQDIVNIGGVVRAMKNFELRDLRLVRPEQYDTRRIEGIAHKSGDLLKRVRHFEDLDSAVADCVHVAAMTARQRAAKRNVQRPRDAAPELLALAGEGPTALLLGPEDRGLTNEELDRCHRSIVIPTSPDYQALNLAQAFTLMAYELYVARHAPPFKVPRRDAPLATSDDLERVFASAEAALRAIEFFKTHHSASIMRTVREVVHRATMDVREAKLLQAMGFELVHFLERKGVR